MAAGDACSPTTATAPFATAWSMNFTPSIFAPASAKNTSPRLTWRLSTANPETTISPAPGAAASLRSSASFILQSGFGASLAPITLLLQE
jgi:hypothetical protein